MPKLKSKSKTKKTQKDTPPAERYAGVIAEDFDAKLNLLIENMGTMEKRFNHNLNTFRLEVMEGFAKVDTRFMAVDRRFDTIDKRFETVDKRFETVDKRFEAADKRFDAIDKRFDVADKRFDKVEKDLLDTRLELKADIKDLETRLSDKIDSFGNRLEQVEAEVADLKHSPKFL